MPGARHGACHHGPPRVQVRSAGGGRGGRPPQEGPAGAGSGDGRRGRGVQACRRARGRSGGAARRIL